MSAACGPRERGRLRVGRPRRRVARLRRRPAGHAAALPRARRSGAAPAACQPAAARAAAPRAPAQLDARAPRLCPARRRRAVWPAGPRVHRRGRKRRLHRVGRGARGRPPRRHRRPRRAPRLRPWQRRRRRGRGRHGGGPVSRADVHARAARRARSPGPRALAHRRPPPPGRPALPARVARHRRPDGGALRGGPGRAARQAGPFAKAFSGTGVVWRVVPADAPPSRLAGLSPLPGRDQGPVAIGNAR